MKISYLEDTHRDKSNDILYDIIYDFILIEKYGSKIYYLSEGSTKLLLRSHFIKVYVLTIPISLQASQFLFYQTAHRNPKQVLFTCLDCFFRISSNIW